MSDFFHCAGCNTLQSDPKIIITLHPDSIARISVSGGAKVMETLPIGGQYYLCGPKCVALMMLDIFAKDEQEREAVEKEVEEKRQLKQKKLWGEVKNENNWLHMG